MVSSLTTEGTLHLVVAWPTGRSYAARFVKTSNEVAAALKGFADTTIGLLDDPVPYAPDADIEDNSHMVAARDESLDTALIDELSKGPSLAHATSHELSTKPLACHALVVQHDTGDVTLFVRKRTPVQLAKKSLLATMFDGGLDQLTEPLFAFDDRYDVVVTSDAAYLLDKKAFERLFKNSPAVLARISNWIADVSNAVPFSKGSASELESILRRNSILRNKFLAIRGKSYLAKIAPADLRAEMVKYGLDPGELMEGDALKVTDHNAKDILRLLNEDLFSGGFSRQHYAASGKRSLP